MTGSKKNIRYLTNRVNEIPDKIILVKPQDYFSGMTKPNVCISY